MRPVEKRTVAETFFKHVSGYELTQN
jgi:hypothetical protein